MLFRALLAVIVVMVAACDDASSVNPSDADAGVAPVLSFELSAPLRLLPRDEAELVVKVEDAAGRPLSSVPVSFAIEGYAPGASLDKLRPASDAQGLARTKIRVGSEGSTFDVRASAAFAAPARLAVQVERVVVHEVVVDLSYEGARGLDRRTISARPNIACGKALEDNSAGEITQTISGPRNSVTFLLDPGISYAIVAWGRDDTGGLLARGCAETKPPLAQGEGDLVDTVTIVLDDHEMSLAGPYPIELELNVEASSKRLASTALEAARARLPLTQTPDADSLLDGIDAELRKNGKTMDATVLANRRASPGFVGSLEAQLKARAVGPSVMIKAFTDVLGTRSPRLLFDGVYQAQGTPMTITLSALYAREGAGGAPLVLPKTLADNASPMLDAAYNQASAQINLRALSLSLSLSAYGQAVFDALDAVTTAGLVGTYRESTGCSVLATWASAQPEIASACDAMCVAQACEAVEAQLLSVCRQALTSLDTHNKISLMGDIDVSDTDADHRVDSLGATTLTGTWSGSSGTLESEVTGQLRVAPPDVIK